MKKIYIGDFPKLENMDASDFSNDKFNCLALFRSPADEPVLLGKSQDFHYPYRVHHNTSCVVFRTYEEAYAYCENRYKKVKTNKNSNVKGDK